VYLCSGQSNMQMTVSAVFNASKEIAEANAYPYIRVFTVGQGTTSATPLKEFSTISQGWSVASSASIGGPNWNYFSGACWFFGRNIYDSEQVPIGLVSTNWGGTIIQAWSSPSVLSQCGIKPTGPNDLSQLWNAMIVPLLPMRVVGATWYQAESNVGAAVAYECLFPAMIANWRTEFGYLPHEFPFFFVQLAAYTFPGNLDLLPQMRLAQTVALTLPKVGMATAVDLGDATSPEGNIHPRDKQDVGKRLALSALAIAYDRKVVHAGPTATYAIAIPAVLSFHVRVFFREDTIASGLTLIPTPPCPVTKDQCGQTFEIQGSNGAWVPATAKIMEHSVVLMANAPAGVVPIAFRYLWSPWPLATLYNLNGNYDWPAPPFLLKI